MSVITSFEIERVPSGDFEVVHVSSAWQYADFATKPLHTEAFRVSISLHICDEFVVVSFFNIFPRYLGPLGDWNGEMLF